MQKGTAYYDRKGNSFQMAAHFHQHNGRPTGKIYVFSGGVFKVSDTGKESDAKTYTNVSKYQGYLMLGFGASGKELEEKWDMKYLGTETIDGVTTDKLELVAKDPAVRKTIAKVTVWMDTARAVSLKVIFDEGEGQSWVCHYTNIKMNQPLPGNAFSFDKSDPLGSTRQRDPAARKQHRKALQRVTRLGRFHGEQQGTAQ